MKFTSKNRCTWFDNSRAKKEQLHYYQAKGIEPLSIEKLQALQLIAPYRFYHKQWSETLEFWPRKPEPGKDTFQYHVLPFDSIDIISKVMTPTY